MDEELGSLTQRSAATKPRVPRVARYFNAGVLLIDLSRWREEHIPEVAMDYMRQVPDTPYSDQDALNVACDTRWTALDDRWNFQDHMRQRVDRLPLAQRPHIVHFISPNKPWIYKTASLNVKLYDAIRRRTDFARTPTARTCEFVLRHLFRLHMNLKRHSSTWRAIWCGAKSLGGVRTT
jgi:lipopolysaccharide biosynthesis glycosyltransferase